MVCEQHSYLGKKALYKKNGGEALPTALEAVDGSPGSGCGDWWQFCRDLAQLALSNLRVQVLLLPPPRIPGLALRRA